MIEEPSITHLLASLLGTVVAGVVGYIVGRSTSDELCEAEAVKRGAARWEADADGKPKFTWNQPANNNMTGGEPAGKDQK
jgi:hypothetical protein